MSSVGEYKPLLQKRLRRTLEDNKALTEPFVDLNGFWEGFKPAFEAAILQVEQEGNLLLNFRFDGKYPGEIDAFRSLLFDNAYDKYKQTNKTQFVGHNQICAVTQEPVAEVWPIPVIRRIETKLPALSSGWRKSLAAYSSYKKD